MKSPLFRLLPLAVLLVVPLPGRAQSDTALNFYQALLKRPAAGPLFEQFYSAWVDAETVEKLESFLTAQAEKSPDARMVLAVFHSRQGALEKAADEWRRAVKDAPQRADAWLALAETEARLRRNTEALEAAERGLRTKPAPDLQRRLLQFQGRTLARNNQRDEARAVWDTLLKENPDDQDLREDYIDLLAETGDNDAAVQAARELADATTDPYRRVIRRTKAGDLLARLQAPDKAIAEYSAALADTGSGSWLERDLLRQIETVFRRADRVEDLSSFMENLAAKEPQRLAVRRTLARLFAEQGKKAEAEKVWRGLLQSAPGDRDLAEAFIQSLTESARHAEAAEQWRGLIKLHPAEAELQLKLAAALHASKDDPGCAAAVRAFLAASGSTEEASLRAAAELGKYKLQSEALALLAETAQKFPASEQARLQHASALHSADKKDEARAAWRAEAALQGRLLPTARSVMAHGEHALTWELLEPRLADFTKDAPALTFICEAAQRAEKWAAGLTQARHLMALASDAVMLGDALTLALRIAERGKLTPLLRKDLESRRAQLSPAESCLLAELLQSSRDRDAARALLEDVSSREPALGLALLVRLHVAAKEFTAAARVQQRVVDGPGGRKAIHIQRLAELCTSAKLFPDALRWTGEWKKLAPGSTAPWLKEAGLLNDSGRAAEAVRALQQASHLWPDDTEILGRLAALLVAAGQPGPAQQVYLRLFEKAEVTQEKLRWLTPLTETARAANQIDSLIADFQRRREQNRQSAMPLLALAECHHLKGDARARLEFMREAARLGQGDPVLLMRAAESAVQNGMLEIAESMLSEAAAMDKTGAALQQRTAVLLQLERSTEAAALLSQLAAGLGAEESAELAFALSDAGHLTAAAAFLREAAARFPDNYRFAWLAAHLTNSAGDEALALQQFVHLATSPFAPMPEAPAVVQTVQAVTPPFVVAGMTGTAQRGQYGQPPVTASLLTPLPDSAPPPTTDSDEEKVAILRAMQEPSQWTSRRGNFAGGSIPRVPGPLWQLRGWAAGHALRLAQSDGPVAVAAVKEKLLAAGLRPAIFSEATAAGKFTGQSGGLKTADLASPDADRSWVLRYILGKLPQIENQQQAVFALDLSMENDARRPFALEAWHRFRESDPAYAIHAALMLLDSDVAVEREAASAALTLLEAHEPRGELLAGAVLALHNLAGKDKPADGSLAARLLARAAPWHRSAAPGPEREWLRQFLLTQLSKGMPDYLDTAALPAAGASAVWKYKAIYRFNDEQVGQWSDVASISVMS